jgi:hypothetical protein
VSGTLLAHMVLMSLMIVLALAAVVIAILKKRRFFKIHRFVTLAGVASGFAGVTTMFVSKAAHAYPHFLSGHSRAGLVAFILLASTAMGGMFALKFGKKGRIAHRVIGGIALTVALLAVAGGIAQIV